MKPMADVVVHLPLHIVSVANKREHWAKRARRSKEHRETVRMVLRQRVFGMSFPIGVHLTRVAPRELDGDNLQSALKAVRDGVADALGIDDRDKRVVWLYDQKKGKPKEYAVEICVEARI